MSDEIDFKKLAEEFDPKLVKWRVGSTNKAKTSGLALCYIDARHVQDRLDEVCGPDKWQDEMFETPRGRTFCTIKIKVNGEWVGKTDAAGDTAVEAEKGSASDAFKRAAVHWGIGRYLYRIEAPWVKIVPAGRSYKICPTETQRLQGILPGSSGDYSKDAAEADPRVALKERATALAEKAKAIKTEEDLKIIHNANMEIFGELEKAGLVKVCNALRDVFQERYEKFKQEEPA